MKRFICLLLVVIMVFALVSCGNDKGETGKKDDDDLIPGDQPTDDTPTEEPEEKYVLVCTPTTDEAEEAEIASVVAAIKRARPGSTAPMTEEEKAIAAFLKLVKKASPTQIKTLTYVDNGSDVLKGEYETTLDGKDFVMSYSYDRYSNPAELASGYITVEQGTVMYKGGLYSEDDGETWTVKAPAQNAHSISLDLDPSNFNDCILTSSRTSLVATFDARQAVQILGRELSLADGEEVILIIRTNGTYLTNINIEYVGAEYETVNVYTSYTYASVSD